MIPFPRRAGVDCDRPHRHAQGLRRLALLVQFGYGEQNKPRLAREFRGKVFGFNLSHSSDLAIYAVGWNRSIGIDVEGIRTNFQVEDIASNYFSPNELHSLMLAPPELRAESFFACWTRQEAYIKDSRGKGLDIPLVLAST